MTGLVPPEMRPLLDQLHAMKRARPVHPVVQLIVRRQVERAVLREVSTLREAIIDRLKSTTSMSMNMRGRP